MNRCIKFLSGVILQGTEVWTLFFLIGKHSPSPSAKQPTVNFKIPIGP